MNLSDFKIVCSFDVLTRLASVLWSLAASTLTRRFRVGALRFQSIRSARKPWMIAWERSLWFSTEAQSIKTTLGGFSSERDILLEWAKWHLQEESPKTKFCWFDRVLLALVISAVAVSSGCSTSLHIICFEIVDRIQSRSDNLPDFIECLHQWKCL